MKNREIVLKKIESQIHQIRGVRVMLDVDLAALYGVPTKRLNEQVRRNLKRFPPDFAFPLTQEETVFLRSQTATSNRVGHGGRSYIPWVFTEHGVAMLSSVLNSEKAIHVNIEIMRAFTALRSIQNSVEELENRLTEKMNEFELASSQNFKTVFDAIKKIIADMSTPRKRVKGLSKE